ncbi:electron transfer flavoprotein subunit beta/FixA family protein [bacterium]|nr:electron transfer flavoprotein subunit beta/FixA family protein [bacterium]
MNIIVCIKQVPETHNVRINPETNTLIREGVESIVNPFDENALEAALQLREAHGGQVTVLSMGPPQTETALRHTMAMGADEAILLSDRAFAGADTWATAYTLSSGIRKIGNFDLILCGKQAIDGDTAQVGPELAEILGIAQAAYVRKIELKDGRLEVERTLEDGYELLSLPLPALLTVTKEINEPRHASLRGVLKAKKAEIPVWRVDDLNIDPNQIGLSGSPTKVIKIFTPQRTTEHKRLEGSMDEIAGELFGILRRETVI